MKLVVIFNNAFGTSCRGYETSHEFEPANKSRDLFRSYLFLNISVIASQFSYRRNDVKVFDSFYIQF
jgi:hypothetical protein